MPFQGSSLFLHMNGTINDVEFNVSVNALSGLFFISTYIEDSKKLRVFKSVNALSGFFFISTITSIPAVAIASIVSMPFQVRKKRI